MSYIKAVVSIAVGCIAGAVAAASGSLAGLIISLACLTGPVSNEILIVIPLGGLGFVAETSTCGNGRFKPLCDPRHNNNFRKAQPAIPPKKRVYSRTSKRGPTQLVS